MPKPHGSKYKAKFKILIMAEGKWLPSENNACVCVNIDAWTAFERHFVIVYVHSIYVRLLVVLV